MLVLPSRVLPYGGGTVNAALDPGAQELTAGDGLQAHDL